MSVVVHDPAMLALIDRDAEVARVAGGFMFTEGPVWHPREHYLLFSDMPGDVIRRWDASKGVQAQWQPSSKANGMTYDRQGRLLVCHHATSNVTRLNADGSTQVLASHFDGKELNSPNDIVVRKDGRIYFTDPTYGRMEYYGVKRESELAFRGVYRIALGGELDLLVDDFVQPNGLCFSLDETLLYINDTERGVIKVFDVKADGSIDNGRDFVSPKGEGEGAPDGMKIDSLGNLYTSGPGGIHIFSAAGTNLGIIGTPEVCANSHGAVRT